MISCRLYQHGRTDAIDTDIPGQFCTYVPLAPVTTIVRFIIMFFNNDLFFLRLVLNNEAEVNFFFRR